MLVKFGEYSLQAGAVEVTRNNKGCLRHDTPNPNPKLRAKLTDLEGRSRRCNVRLIELDRAHRALRPKPAAGEKPRAVITKDIRAARKKRGELKYDGKLVYIYEDYCPEVLDQRSEYKEVMRQLYALNLKPSLLYPARLFIRAEDGSRRRLASAKEAVMGISQ
ncbi:unnamed protein product [Pleuronectes platessa]|uniref:Uncharacterized protein n=1 Tax=Pleuronectes platessa TaxID=8262 RepID=A0A9N7VQ27_PLEPL|nr:unnamed protein product [Pleuronectes platessa]